MEVETVYPAESVFFALSSIQPNQLPIREIEQGNTARVVWYEKVPAIGMHGRRLGRDEIPSVNSFQSISADPVNSATIPVANDRAPGASKGHITQGGMCWAFDALT